MKQNVDLTINRDFNRFNWWNIQGSEKLEDRSFDKELILTGTKEDREYKREELEFCTSNGDCDCCGSNIPWGRVNGLCYGCYEKMQEEYHNPTWRNQ